MYIRRKVFSLLEDEMGEERYFSTTDFELTDDVEERYYSNDEDKKGMSKAAKVALGTGAGLAAVAGGIYGSRKAGQKIAKSVAAEARRYKNAATKGQLNYDTLYEANKKLAKKEAIADLLQGKPIIEGAKKGKAKVTEALKKLKKAKKDAPKASDKK